MSPKTIRIVIASPGDVQAERQVLEEVVEELSWEGQWMIISSVTKTGTEELTQRVSQELELLADEAETAAAPKPETAEFPEEPFDP